MKDQNQSILNDLGEPYLVLGMNEMMKQARELFKNTKGGGSGRSILEKLAEKKSWNG